MRFKIRSIYRSFEGSHAVKQDGETELQARKVGVKILLRNARGGTVMFPNFRNRQFNDVFDMCVADDRTYRA